MRRNYAMLLLLFVLFAGCFNDEKKEVIVTGAVENIFQYMLGATHGDAFKGLRQATYTPADNFMPIIIGCDINNPQGSINEYRIDWLSSNGGNFKVYRDKIGEKEILIGVISNPGTYNFRIGRGDKYSQEIEVKALSELEYIAHYLKDTYLWNGAITNLNPQNYSSPKEILSEVIKSSGGKDKWSFMLTKAENEALSLGERNAFGFWAQPVLSDNVKVLAISDIDKNSPFYINGVKRGDKILSIGGYDVNALIGEDEKWTKFREVLASTASVEFLIKQKDGEKKFNIQKSTYTTSTVPISKVIYTGGGKKIGYIQFTSFIEMSYKELDAAFAEFKNNQITDIIVDLRYNGGGLVDVSNYFATILGGSKVKDKIFGTMSFNNNYNSFQLSTKFKNLSNTLELNKIAFITTKNTASSSEMLINSLKPFKDIITIGSNSNGKFVGMYPCQFYDNVLYSINFSEKNAEGNMGSSEGIVPEITAADNINFDYGDVNEDSIKAAVEYIKTGVKPTNVLKKMEKNTLGFEPTGKENFLKVF